MSQIQLLLRTPARCSAGMRNSPSKDAVAGKAKDLDTRWLKLGSSRQHEFARNVLRRVTVGQTTVWIEIDHARLLAALLGQRPEALRALCTHELGVLTMTGEFKVLQRGGQIRVIRPTNSSSVDGSRLPSLVKAIARARDWYERIVSGEIESIDQLMRESGLTRSYIMRIVKCARLCPKIVEAVLAGSHRPDLSLKWILADVPLDWGEQEKRILSAI